MGVRIRLARFGRRNLPFYRIFVADSRCPRDGRHLEVVGHYDPLPGALRVAGSCVSGCPALPAVCLCRWRLRLVCNALDSQGRQQAHRLEL